VGTADDALRIPEQVCDQDDGGRIARHAYFTLRSITPALATSALVQDVVSDAFLTACEIIRSRPERLPTTREEMLAWLRRIVLFKCLEAARARRRGAREVALTADNAALPAEHTVVDILDSGNYRAALTRAYAALSDDERAVMQLYLDEHITSTAIAKRLGREPAAVRKTKQRAIERLRRHLDRVGA
jgi:RNA polymerase sigma factor (sigma-70 family)